MTDLDNTHFLYADESQQMQITIQPNLCEVFACKLGYKLVGDNIDIIGIYDQKVTMISLHFLNSFAVLDRVNLGSLPIEIPIPAL